MDDWELIVEFGAAGEGVSLYGKQLEDSSWQFVLKNLDYEHKVTVLSEDKEQTSSNESSIGDWNQAISLMNRYPWKSMHPIKIHPLFKVFLWNKVNYDNRYEDCSVRWYTKCFIPEAEEELYYGNTCTAD